MKFYLTLVDDEANMPTFTAVLHTDVVDKHGNILTKEAVLKMMQDIEKSSQISISHNGASS